MIKRKLSTIIRVFKKSPVEGAALLAYKLGVDIYPWIDAKYKNRDSILGFDPDTLDVDVATRLTEVLKEKNLKSAPQSRTLDEFFYQHKLEKQESAVNSDRLAALFNNFGSDKAGVHDYYKVYQVIIDDILEKKGRLNISEIGIGSNNLDTLSNMGAGGRPGASLRAFRDYDPRIAAFGGDFDERILFQEDRIRTSYVNQLEPTTIEKFLQQTRPEIIIDDGLHALRPNVNVFIEYIRYAKSIEDTNIWLVIEDICCERSFDNFWLHVISNLCEGFTASLITGKSSLMLVVCKDL